MPFAIFGWAGGLEGGRPTKVPGALFGFGEGDGDWRGYKFDCDEVFDGRDNDGCRCHRQLRPWDDTLGQGDFRGVWVGHLVLADVAVHCRQQNGAECRERQGFNHVLHDDYGLGTTLLFGEGSVDSVNDQLGKLLYEGSV